MLELRNIRKVYQTGDFKQVALNGVSMKLESGELVSILGPSGCGKTTLLNIVGGLDRYTDGDLIINGKSTKDFTSSDWDSYRNNSIGFVFQSYNLINHISVIDNVEMALTLSGVGPKEKKERAMRVLERVGLEKHAHKKPNQLSGGQKQRVAIARALANDPDIILMDEPTGALDSTTSIQILDLVKEVASDKLIIMVTHNPELAEAYSTRIIKLKDGEIIDDSKPNTSEDKEVTYQPKKTAMSFFTAFKLSFNNLRTKIVRSIITALAASIGIIGVALVLSISNGFGSEVNRLQKESLSGMPITISQYAINFDSADYMNGGKKIKPEPGYIYPNELIQYKINNITTEYINYVKNMDSSLYESISFTYNDAIYNLVSKRETIIGINPDEINFNVIPSNINYLMEQFELIDGEMPKESHQVVIVVDQDQKINQSVLSALGINSNGEKIPFNEIYGLKLSVASNDDYYVKVGSNYAINSDLTNAYENGIKLEITGVLKAKTDLAPLLLSGGIAFLPKLSSDVLLKAKTSQIVIDQLEANYDLIKGIPFSAMYPKEEVLKKIGGSDIPTDIKIYSSDFETKDKVKEYLAKYNEGKELADQIVYTDLAAEFTNVISSLIDGISVVLIAFAGISLVVSSIMIGIITYVSVLERTKEIGVLRSLGARKKDITRVFNAETFIIGLAAGIAGVVITMLLNIPLDMILSNLIPDMANLARLSLKHAVLLIIVSVILTQISGLLPALMAASKDPVEALREEN